MRIALASLVALLGLYGCEERATTAPELWCAGFCDAVERCEGRALHTVCLQDCVARRPGLSNISPEAAELLEPCVAELSCGALEGDEAAWDAELAACWEQAEGEIEPPEHIQDFCTDFTSALFECGYVYSAEVCDLEHAMLAESISERLDTCLAAPHCPDVLECVDGVNESL